MAIIERREHTAGGGSRLERTALRGLVLVAVVGLSMLAAACGGGSPGAKVAQVGTTSSTNNSGSSGASGSGSPTAYSACMRSHGVPNFPDPDSQGHIKITSGVGPGGQKTGVDVDAPQYKRAQRACQKLQPNGGRPTAAQQAKEQQQALKFAQCMRSHGVPNFPDPDSQGHIKITSGVGPGGQKTGVDPNTPQFKAAQQTCQKVVPGSPIVAAPHAPPGGGSGSGPSSQSGSDIKP
jgi:hypothetical protein